MLGRRSCLAAILAIATLASSAAAARPKELSSPPPAVAERAAVAVDHMAPSLLEFVSLVPVRVAGAIVALDSLSLVSHERHAGTVHRGRSARATVRLLDSLDSVERRRHGPGDPLRLSSRSRTVRRASSPLTSERSRVRVDVGRERSRADSLAFDSLPGHSRGRNAGGRVRLARVPSGRDVRRSLSGDNAREDSIGFRLRR